MADYAFVTQAGVILPDTSDLLATVEAEFREAFGADLVTTPDTPQGVLITAEVLARDAVVRNNAALANQINPNLAGGRFLDAIWALTGGSRVGATRTSVPGVALTGAPGAIIPAGSQASVGAGGAIFELTGGVILSPAGSGVGTFQALDTGPVACPAGDLDTIVSGVLGWETVTNPVAGTPGQSEESDLAARRRRRNTLALQSVALPEACVSGLYDVAGVTSVLFRENITDAPLVIEGFELGPHSILAVVEGGTDADVAAELLRRKSLGAGWNGATTVNVVEPVSGQSYPVKFQRPAPVTIFAEVTVRQSNAAQIADPELVVREAIVAYAAGLYDGEAGFDIGADVSPFEFSAAINYAAPGLFVTSVKIGTDPGAMAATVVPITIVQKAQILAGNIAVIVQ